MSYRDSILEAVGSTPLVKLHKIGAEFASHIYVKVEALNPGGSIKDRAAIHMIEVAEARNQLQPGGTIVEATAGNTGAGLAMAAAVKGYKLIVVMPDKMSDEKVALLKAFGAEVVMTPTKVPPDSPDNYIQKAKAIAARIPGAFRVAQFENAANPEAHYHSTGAEIWHDTEGVIDVLAGGIGTGGTLSGAGRYLKERNPGLLVIGADPPGSILSGDQPAPFKVEGIGEDYFPDTYDRHIVDRFYRITDRESFQTARRLAREEGILAGGSSGTALAAALKFAAETPDAKEIVVILPDTGRNYLSKLYNDRWMIENHFLEETKGVPDHAF